MDTTHQGQRAGPVRPAYRGGESTPRPPRPGRTNLQNKFIHAHLNDIADQLPWPKDTGELHNALWWKRRCTLQWMLENKMPVEIITPLYDHGDEEFGLLLPHTSDLNTKQCAELSEWIIAFGTTNGVTFREHAPSKAAGR